MLTMMRKMLAKEKHSDGVETDGFLSRHDFDEQLLKERARADRAGAFFTLLAFDVETPPGVNGKAEAMEILASILAKRARLTDTKGWFGDRLAIILPNTLTENADRVARPVQEQFKKIVVSDPLQAPTAPKIAYQTYAYPKNGIEDVPAGVAASAEAKRVVPVA
jgi:GGDEF domain-containing protein